MSESIEHFMSTDAVAKALRKTPATVRGWIHRDGQGKSTPSHPIPVGKISGVHIFLRHEVEDFIPAKN